MTVATAAASPFRTTSLVKDPPTAHAQPNAGYSGPTSPWLWVAVVLALSLALRIALLPHRWVNPDEGAHLMDGKLVLDGLIPILDFDARQVLYVYMLAGWERLVGAELLAARVLPMLLGVGVTVLVFLLARYLVGVRAALVATVVYGFLPIAVIWSLNIHLEVVTLVFTSLGYLALARALRTEASPRQLAAVGAVFGITFYFRESALAHMLAAASVLTIVGRRTPRRLAGQLLALFGGFAAVAVVMVVLFARYLTPLQLWISSLNPLHLPLKALGLLPVEGGAAEIARARDVRQSWGVTQRNLRDAFFFGSFLLLSAAAAFGARGLGRRRFADDIAMLVLAAWLVSLGLAYGYWVYVFGFYPQYFTEFLPPLAILLGAVVSAAADEWLPPGRAGLAFGLALVAMAAAFVAGERGIVVPTPVYILSAALLLGAAGMGRAALARWSIAAGVAIVAAGAGFALTAVAPSDAGRALRVLALLLALAAAFFAAVPGRPGRAERLAFALLVILGGSALLAYDYSGHRIGVSYYCVWPRSVLGEVASRVRSTSDSTDEVLSGGVIWALEADRHPFLNISHPLSYLDGLTPEERTVIERGLAKRAPRLILLDGYTERTILADSAARKRLLGDRYQAAGLVTGGRFPVRLFVLRAGADGASPERSAPAQ
jgi:4-amino-4-deoxy-L-arabinose transferase-like glycosyltransferase